MKTEAVMKTGREMGFQQDYHWLACLLIPVLLHADLASCFTYNVTLNLHIKLIPQLEEFVDSELDPVLHCLLPQDEISFLLYQPHISLYLTEFQPQRLPDIIQSFQETVASKFGPCNVTLSNVYGGGAYGMWNVSLPDCLQEMSDQLVLATYDYATPNQTVPSWVYSLPEPTRSEKIQMVHKYGSPNVFSQFQPHVTLAWDDQDNVTEALKTLSTEFNLHRSYVPDKVAIGSVGPYGTVIRGKDIIECQFPHVQRESMLSCSSLYSH